MLNKYFVDLEKKLNKPPASKKKTASKKKSAAPKPNLKVLQEELSRILPQDLVIDSSRPINSAGYSPDGADFIIYNKYCEAIQELMGGYIPQELVMSTLHVVPKLDNVSLAETLNRITSVKKLSTLSDQMEEEGEEQELAPVPAIALVYDSEYAMIDLKTDVTNYYMAKAVENLHEADIIAIFNYGILIKDWRSKRSFIGLETHEDTMMWLYVLLNEYLDVDRPKAVDFRNYIKRDIVYKEF